MNLERLVRELEESEGLRTKPYRCTAGKLTIGIGRNLEDTGISKDEARWLCQHDIREKFARLSKHKWFTDLDFVRQEAMIRMAFNIGVNGVRRFKKMIAALEAKDFKLAAIEALDSKWATQVGARAVELSRLIELGRY